MTEPTRDQIRGLLEHATADAPRPLPWSDVELRAAVPEDPEPTHRRNVWLAAAASLIVVSVAGIILLVDDETDRVRTDDDPVPTATVPDDSTTVTSVVPTTSPPTTSTTSVPGTSTSVVPDASVSVQVPADDAAPPVLAPPESGQTQQSIVGDITWTLLEGDASELPATVNWEVDGEFFAIEGSEVIGQRTWRSPDGIDWELTDVDPGPFSHPSFDFDGGTWASLSLSDGRPGLTQWDGTAFVPVELPAVDAPRIDGLQDDSYVQSPVVFGDELVVPVDGFQSIPWSDVFATSTSTSAWWDDDLDAVVVADNDQNLGLLTAELVEGDPVVINFNDVSTRDVVASFDVPSGADAEAVRRNLMFNGGVPYGGLLVGDADGFAEVEPPWGPWSTSEIAPLEDRLLAVVSTPQWDDSGNRVDEVELWTSFDAVTWAPVELPTPSGSRLEWANIVGDGTTALLTIVSTEPNGDQRFETWSTADGVSWESSDIEGVDSFSTDFADFGWLTYGIYTPGRRISVSPDGGVWQDLGFPAVAEQASIGTFAFDRTIFVTSDDGDTRTVWVGRVEGD